MLEIKEFLIKNGDTIRPESDIHKKFKGSLVEDVTSKHEYDQYYRDIYDRFVKHSIKHKKMADVIKKFKDHEDMDFIVAYHGFFDKEKNFEKSFTDLEEKKSLLYL